MSSRSRQYEFEKVLDRDKKLKLLKEIDECKEIMKRDLEKIQSIEDKLKRLEVEYYYYNSILTDK